MMIKIILIIIISFLFRLGGWDKAKWSGYRDVLIPLLLALYYSFILNTPYMLFLALSYQVMRMGYGIPDSSDSGSFLGRIFKTAWATRGIWALLVSGIGALPLVIYTHQYISYIIYISLNTLANGVLGKIEAEVNLHELMAGACIGSVVLLLKA